MPAGPPEPSDARDCVSSSAMASGGRVAIPKSSNFTRQSRSHTMFALFRSRCTIACSCACASAPAICTPIRRTVDGGRPPTTIRERSGRPSTYSIAIHGSPSASPTSYTWQMLGWLSEEAARASERTRSLASAPSLDDPAVCRNLRAIFRSRRLSRARYTVPIAPLPRTDKIS